MATKGLTFWLLILAGAGLLGALFDIVLLRKLLIRATKRHLETERVVYSSLKFWILAWTILLSGYFALQILHINASILYVIKKVLSVLGIMSVSLILANISAKLVDLGLARVRGSLPGVSLISGTVRVLVLLLGVLTALHHLGISITPILTGLGVGGVAVALALQETLTNVISGINILLAGKIRVGDFVRLETGEEGFVEDITWRSTTIRELSNNIIIVPNTKLSSAIVKNFDLPDNELSVIVQVSVTYDSDLEKVERVTIEVAKQVLREVTGGVSKFEPFVRFHTFSDSSIDFSVILRVNQYTDQYHVKHEFIKKLHRRYNEEGIQFPYPQRVVHFGGASFDLLKFKGFHQ